MIQSTHIADNNNALSTINQRDLTSVNIIVLIDMYVQVYSTYIHKHCNLQLLASAAADYPGADLGFSERGAKHSSGSLKQGVWGGSPPEVIGYFVL